MRILDYFPLPVPRPQQVQAMEYVEDVLKRGYRDIVLELPTGVGKTAIACAIAAWAKDHLNLDQNYDPGAYILVQQKVLQDQIEAELDRLGGTTRAALIKASIEYKCPEFKRCSVGLVDRRCGSVGIGACSYKLAKGRFLSAPVAVTNYSYYLTERRYVGQITPRQVLICDECHSLASIVLRQVDVIVSEENLGRYAPGVDASELRLIQDMKHFVSWLEDDYIPAVSDQAEIISALCDSDENVAEAYEISQHYQKVGAFIERVKTEPNGWIFWSEEGRTNKITLTARPLDAAPYFDQLIRKEAPLRIYLSAFPGPKDVFRQELGLEKVAWMRHRSPFAIEHRPIHLLSVGSMSRSRQQAALPSVLRVVRRIVETHADTRGIIHTHSYKLADAVEEMMKQNGLMRRLIYPKTADEREAALKLHASTPGGILLSPSVGEGFDFRGDLARWQIICKVPYLSLSSKHTVALMERNPAWYRAESVKHFIQICGRICRSSDDHGETYVLDSDAAQLLRETSSYLPAWFREAIFTAAGEPFFAD